MNVVDMLQVVVANMLIYSTPLIFTSIGGVFSERGGIVNVGLEGIMTIGAFASVVFNLSTASIFGGLTPWISILFGAVIGAAFASLHAVATVNLRADHIISGTVLNLMAPSLGVFLLMVIYNQGQVNISQQLGYWNFPLLDKIPVIGKIFFTQTSLLPLFPSLWPLYLGTCSLRHVSDCACVQSVKTLKRRIRLVSTFMPIVGQAC